MRKYLFTILTLLSILQLQLIPAQAQVSSDLIDCATEMANLHSFTSSKLVGTSKANRESSARLKNRYLMLVDYGKLLSPSNKTGLENFKKRMATSLIAKTNETVKVIRSSPAQINGFLVRSTNKVNKCWDKYGPRIKQYIQQRKKN